jgi:hypothetical protein
VLDRVLSVSVSDDGQWLVCVAGESCSGSSVRRSSSEPSLRMRKTSSVTPGPPPSAFFYLHRGRQGSLDGPGSYGGTGGRERVAASGDCAQ